MLRGPHRWEWVPSPRTPDENAILFAGGAMVVGTLAAIGALLNGDWVTALLILAGFFGAAVVVLWLGSLGDGD